MKNPELTKRELEIYEEGFKDGRADFFSEFLMLLEEGLPQKAEAKPDVIN